MKVLREAKMITEEKLQRKHNPKSVWTLDFLDVKLFIIRIILFPSQEKRWTSMTS